MNLPFNRNEPLIVSGRDVTAVLGPTNTGKTHLAIERMVAHDSGVIGLPLRLLAREVYGRVVEKVGASKVALITGEEKIVPPGARFSVCTVEAMPRRTDASFVAIDEVQLAADFERGHIFTDRILHLRGRQETLLLGAATMRGILERLLRGINVVTRPRLSHLAYAGSKKLTRLPRRSAIVAFSADEVYAIAELIRRQRGAAAVVLGALSPRTRNAQVELYQSGDVDYLVATDAIGMGLNLDVDHVAFAQNRKFDGHQFRELSPAEMGQIAGRAGRHLRDGTFGVTGQVDPLSDELVRRIEGHEFDPVKVLQWRSANFDFASLDALKRSIDAVPAIEGLTRALPADDARALEFLSRDAEIAGLAQGSERVAQLWDACALPDYRRIAPAQHAEIVGQIFLDLARRGHVDEAYMAEQVDRAASTEGDIDTLSQRIAQIRTWTFVSHRPGWLADPAHWQEKTREIEDRLSDALHERLTKRFVDRRTSVLMRRLRENSMLEAEISPNGDVLVEGHHVGELQGFRFTADQSADGEDAKAVRAAAQKVLAQEFEARAERFAIAGNGDFALGSDGMVRWIGTPVATLTATEDPLRPRAILLADEQLTGPARDKVAARIERFVAYQVETLLKPLSDLKSADQLTGIARGIAFRLVENFGLVNRRDIADDVRALDQDARAALRRLGVRFGAYHIFVPALVKPGPAGLVTLLWALANDGKDKAGFGEVVHGLASGRTSLAIDPAFDPAFYRLAGYRSLGRRAVRVDILERLADLIRPAAGWKDGAGPRPEGAYGGGAFIVTPAMMSILGATADDMEEILKGLGYRAEPKAAGHVETRLAGFDAAAREKIEADARTAAAQAAGEAQAAAGTGDAATADPSAAATIEDGGAAAALPASGESDADAALPETATATTLTEEAAGDTALPGTAPDITPAEEAAAAHPASGESEIAAVLPETVADTTPTGEAAADAALPGTASHVAPGEDAAAEMDAPASGPAGDVSAADEVAAHEQEAAAAPRPPVMVWRQGRPEGRSGPRHRQGGPRGGAARDGAEARGGNRRFDRKSTQRKGEAADGASREERKDRPREERHGKDRRNDRQARGGKPHAPREERPARIDPDSPFAKLAALRDQLKK